MIKQSLAAVLLSLVAASANASLNLTSPDDMAMLRPALSLKESAPPPRPDPECDRIADYYFELRQEASQLVVTPREAGMIYTQPLAELPTLLRRYGDPSQVTEDKVKNLAEVLVKAQFRESQVCGSITP